MSDFRRIYLLMLIMLVVCLGAAGAGVGLLYDTAVQQQKQRLVEVVVSQARLIEAVARFDGEYSREDRPGGTDAATLSQIVNSQLQFQGLGETGEFALARRVGDRIEFVLDHRYDSSAYRDQFKLGSEVAEPMQRALLGQSGVIIGQDYRGETVLAAYEPVAVLNLGIVAKIDMSEIREPFIHASETVLVLALLLVLVGAYLFRRIGNPMVVRLRESEAKLSNAQRIAHMGNWEWDIGTGQLWWSDEVYRIFGCVPGEFDPSYGVFMEFVHPDDRALVKRKITDAVRGKEDYAFEHRVVLANGEERIVHEIAEITFNNAGDAILMNGAVQDVTEKRNALSALHDKEVHIGAVLDNVVDGIITIGERGTVCSFNSAAEKMFGYKAKEIIGNSITLLMNVHDAEHHDGYVSSYIRTGYSAILGLGLREVEAKRRDGTVFPMDISISEMFISGQRLFIGVVRDITDRKEAENKLAYLANHDLLTDLPNRTRFMDRLGQALAFARRENEIVAVVFMDIDRFKLVNDTFGLLVGDKLLQSVAARLHACLRESDTLARLGGDEFVMVLSGIENLVEITNVLEKITHTLSQIVEVDGNDLRVTASMGVSLFPDDGGDGPTLLKYAAAAMSNAKDQGQGHDTIRYFTKEMNLLATEKLRMENDLRLALDLGQLVLFYQPKLDLETGQVHSMEALLRWERTEGEFTSPDKFIPLAEDTGLIVPIGEWVLFTACAQAKVWRDAGLGLAHVAVNVSGRQIRGAGFLDTVSQALNAAELPPECLQLELTESLVMQDVEENIQLLEAIKGMGVSLSVDDFGTGYSSLSYLKRLPLDVLKIDRSFVNDVPGNAEDTAIVDAIISLAGSLRLTVVAEGVETQEQADYLSRSGCAEGQGFLFSHPLPPDEFEAFVREYSETLHESKPAAKGRKESTAPGL